MKALIETLAKCQLYGIEFTPSDPDDAEEIMNRLILEARDILAAGDAYSKTDWALLATQKVSLLDVIDTLAEGAAKEHLDGIVNFLDAIQDDANSQGWSVFPAELEEEVEVLDGIFTPEMDTDRFTREQANDWACEKGVGAAEQARRQAIVDAKYY
jgi:hypothetical protein